MIHKRSPLNSIAFDIDDTVIDTAIVLIEHYNKLYGTSFNYENWNHHNTANLEMGFDPQKALKLFEELAAAHLFPLSPGAKDVLLKIHKVTKKPLTFITARRPLYAIMGLEFLHQELKVPLCVQSSNDEGIPYATKLGCLTDMGVSTLVEDQAFEAEKYLEAGIKVLLFKRPWNKEDRDAITHQNFIVFTSWKDMGSFLLNGDGNDLG
jgi:hypothetical protein